MKLAATRVGLVGLAVVLPLLTGCGNDALTSSTANKMRKLSDAYLELALKQNSIGPKTEALFKKRLQTMAQEVNSYLKPEEIEGLFLSDRDGKPLVVLYGVSIGPLTSKPGEGHVVAHEKLGVGNRKLVVFTNCSVLEVDDARLHELLNPRP